MVVMPYYNKPSQDGMREHVLAVARAVPCPIVLYNIPGRSVVDLAADTIGGHLRGGAERRRHQRGDRQRAPLPGARRAGSGDRLTVLSGDDSLTLPMMSVGAAGVISVTSNVCPRAVSEVTRRVLAGDWTGAREAHLALLELHSLMFVEPNPAPAKAALSEIHGRMSAGGAPAPGPRQRGPAPPDRRRARARGGCVRIAVHGAAGRMGQSIIRLAASEGASLVGAIVPPHSSVLGRDAGEVAGAGVAGVELTADTASGLLGADVVIDFSTAAALPHLLQLAARARVAVVSGTTRLDATCERLLDEAAKVVPVLWAPNTSVGVQVLAELVTRAAQQLGLDFDVEIVETHHRAKIDSPSGTAERLRHAVTEARTDLRAVHGREGNVGPRSAGEIGVLAVRGGDVIGDHTVHFLGPGERIELTHRATSRDLFARGALRAARFVQGSPPGRYAMADVIRGSTALGAP